MKITSRYNSERVIWESPCSTMRETVILAVSKNADLCDANLRGANLCDANLRGADLCGANLCDANLRGADLCGADLCDANLCGADLCDANLRGANLRGADLCDANLRGANLCDANLRGADLCDANLRGANLCDANLRGANLCDANLRGADLRGADLESIRVDFIAHVLNLPHELEFLRDAIIGGRISGSSYSGDCACLAGTLAHAKGIEDYNGEEIKNGCTFIADASSPRERFFLAIKTGDTPETNSASAIALKWTEEAIAMRDNCRTK